MHTHAHTHTHTSPLKHRGRRATERLKPQQVTLVSVHCTLHAHQSPLHEAQRGRGGMLPKNNTKDCQAPPPCNTIAPWFDDPSRRERNFFFFFQTAHITRWHFNPVEYGRLGSFKSQKSTRDWSQTYCNYTVLCRPVNALSRENKWVF